MEKRHTVPLSLVAIFVLGFYALMLAETVPTDSGTPIDEENTNSLPVVGGHGQYYATSFEEIVSVAPITVLATVKSVEIKMIDESEWSSYLILDEDFSITGISDPVWESYHVPYLFVTLDVDEYVKDSTGQFSDTIVAKTKGTGEGIYNGKKHFYTYYSRDDFPLGEQAIYGISVFEDNVGIDPYVAKFNISDDGMVQSRYMKDTLRLYKITENHVQEMLAQNVTTLKEQNIDDDVLESLPIPLDQAISMGKEIAQR